MNIREVEEKSALPRANIRFYEQEGLLSPQRRPNGYRNYSEEDVVTLQRIRLLRSLSVPIEKIRALQSGETELDAVLCEASELLSREAVEKERARSVCDKVQRDGARYATLDAGKYLDALSHGEDKSLSAPVKAPVKLRPNAAVPAWQRFLAREIDNLLCTLLLLAPIVAAFRINISAVGLLFTWFVSFLAMLFMLLLEPLLLRRFGTTPGKWMFGLFLRDADRDCRPSYSDGLVRTASVLWSGMGFQIPIYSLICLVKSAKRALNEELQPWELGENGDIIYTVRRRRLYLRIPAVAAVLAVVFAAAVFAAGWASLPIHRGDLTVAEFAENYNESLRYYDFDGLLCEMMEDGSLVTARTYNSPNAGDITYVTDDEQIRYSLSDGILTQVTYTPSVAADQHFGISGFYGFYMKFLALSFAGAQADLGFTDQGRVEMLDWISALEPGVSTFTLGNTTLACEFLCDGYQLIRSDGAYFMTPIEGESQHFSLQFTMTRR